METPALIFFLFCHPTPTMNRGFIQIQYIENIFDDASFDSVVFYERQYTRC